MLFDHSKKSSTDEIYQCVCKSNDHVDSSSHLAPFVGISQSLDACVIPRSSGVDIFEQAQSENKIVIESHSEPLPTSRKGINIHDDYLADDSAIVFSSSTDTEHLIRSESSKRPVRSDESCGRTWKRSRVHEGQTYPLFSEFFPSSHAMSPHVSEDEHLCGANKDLTNDETDTSEEGTSLHDISNMPWDMHGCGEDEDNKPEGICSSFLDRYPRKPVALGKDHQVDIPDICSEVQCAKDSTSEKFMDIFVTPVAENNSEIHGNDSFGHEKSCCDCTDQGSARCIRQHVGEAREKTKKDIGEQKFADLGFYDMGEDVALKWTVEEENLFHQVVFANPASLGKNFWNVLPQFLPNKSRQDLVSYYFNVFMLRKRSEQNRLDPLNVDSDNDEWMAGEDGRVSMEEYEEDSMVESPIYHDEIVYSNDGHLEVEEDNYYDVQGNKKYTSYDFGVAVNNGIDNGLLDVPERYVKSKSVSNHNIESAENASRNMDLDFQQGSRTLHEATQDSEADCHNHGLTDIAVVRCNGAVETVKGADNVGAGCNVDNPGKKLNAECRNDDGISQLTNPEFSDIYCEQKPWDLDYSSRTESVVDFLPTCNVIEEVFGNGTWDS